MIIDVSSRAEIALLARAVREFRGVDGGDRYAATPGALAFVAIDESEILGWCWGYHLPRPDDTSMLYLHDLEVAEAYRRRGTGRQLIETFISAGRTAGASKMFLCTSEDNVPARRLYEELSGTLAAHGPTVTYWFGLDGATRHD